MKQHFRILENADWVARAGAAVCYERLAKGGTVALAGGSTPLQMYRLLAGSPLDWSAIRIFWSDERLVAPDHADSNVHMAREALLDHVSIPPGNIHAPRTDLLAPPLVARVYESDVRGVVGGVSGGGGGGRGMPRFDLILLGMGPDAHTASLFPGSPAVRERERLVVAILDAPKPPCERITFTPGLINAARCVVVLVAGAEKAAALKEVFEGPNDPDRYPAQTIAPEDGELIWLVDEAAASRLEEAK